jgi:hypothetical protein
MAISLVDLPAVGVADTSLVLALLSAGVEIGFEITVRPLAVRPTAEGARLTDDDDDDDATIELLLIVLSDVVLMDTWTISLEDFPCVDAPFVPSVASYSEAGASEQDIACVAAGVLSFAPASFSLSQSVLESPALVDAAAAAVFPLVASLGFAFAAVFATGTTFFTAEGRAEGTNFRGPLFGPPSWPGRAPRAWIGRIGRMVID